MDGRAVWLVTRNGIARCAPHGMNITGGADRIGAENGLWCTTCHNHHNAELPHGPPGAHVWLLAPVAMQWWGKSSAQICEQIKDPARSGGARWPRWPKIWPATSW